MEKKFVLGHYPQFSPSCLLFRENMTNHQIGYLLWIISSVQTHQLKFCGKLKKSLFKLIFFYIVNPNCVDILIEVGYLRRRAHEAYYTVVMRQGSATKIFVYNIPNLTDVVFDPGYLLCETSKYNYLILTRTSVCARRGMSKE